jgi:hypothetical protein
MFHRTPSANEHWVRRTKLIDTKPVVWLQYEPSVLLMLADPRNPMRWRWHGSLQTSQRLQPATGDCPLRDSLSRLRRISHAAPTDVIRTCCFGLCDEASQLC